MPAPSSLLSLAATDLPPSQRPTGYHVPDRPSRETCKYRDLLRPLAYCVWALPDLRAALSARTRGRLPVTTLPHYVRWLLRTARGPAEFLQFVRLPLAVNELLFDDPATRNVAVAY